MDWTFQVADHFNIPEHTVAWLVKVADHINIPEH